MADAENCPNPLPRRDAIALIGLTATLDGLVMSGQMDPHARERLRSRLRRDGAIPSEAAEPGEELSAALDALNQRLRWVLGEYDSPPR